MKWYRLAGPSWPAAEARFVRPQGGTTVRYAALLPAFLLAACSGRNAESRAAAGQPPSAAGTTETLGDTTAKPSVSAARGSRFIVQRGDTIWVRLESGDSMSFVNEPDSGCCGISHRFLGTLPTGHLVVETAYEDGISVSVIDPHSGHIATVGGEPILSPSGHLFATINEESYSDDRVSVWRLDTTHDWVHEYDDTVGPMPDHLHWLDDSTLSSVVGAPGSDTGMVMVERRGGRWRHREP